MTSLSLNAELSDKILLPHFDITPFNHSEIMLSGPCHYFFYKEAVFDIILCYASMMLLL